jgi:hypothetical protein
MPKSSYRAGSLDELAHYSGDPWVPTNRFFHQRAEADMPWFWEHVIWPFIGNEVNFAQTLDLAAGLGRNSEYLLRHAETLVIMDFQPGNVEACVIGSPPAATSPTTCVTATISGRYPTPL